MRIWYFSCLHLDVVEAISIGRRQPTDVRVSPIDFDPGTQADVCVIAGDFYPDLIRSVEKAGSIAKRMPVVMVPGNRDLYRGAFRPRNKRSLCEIALRRAKSIGNIHLLDNTSTVIDGVRFIGSTMWSDLSRVEDKAIFNTWNDFKKIFPKDDVAFTPEQHTRAFERSKRYIAETLALPFDGPSIVVSHTIPHPAGVALRHQSSPYGAFFNNDLTDLIEMKTGPAAWIFANNLEGCDLTVGPTRLLSNPHGHLLRDGSPENPNFDFDKVFSLNVEGAKLAG